MPDVLKLPPLPDTPQVAPPLDAGDPVAREAAAKFGDHLRISLDGLLGLAETGKTMLPGSSARLATTIERVEASVDRLAGIATGSETDDTA